jgi:general stress protein 26
MPPLARQKSHADPQELERKFWKALKSDMTVMLGLDGVEDGHARPMTAQLEHDDRGPIWFFTANELCRSFLKAIER